MRTVEHENSENLKNKICALDRLATIEYKMFTRIRGKTTADKKNDKPTMKTRKILGQRYGKNKTRKIVRYSQIYAQWQA